MVTRTAKGKKKTAQERGRPKGKPGGSAAEIPPNGKGDGGRPKGLPAATGDDRPSAKRKRKNEKQKRRLGRAARAPPDRFRTRFRRSCPPARKKRPKKRGS